MLSYKNECKRKLISSCFLIFFCNLFACNMIDNVPNISPGKISPTWISAKRSTTKPLKSPFSVTFLLSVNPWSFLNSTNWSPVSVVIFVAVFFKDDLSNVFRLFNIVCRFSESRLWVLVSKLFAMKIWKMVKTTNLSFLIVYTWATYFHFAYDTILFSIQKSYLEKKLTREYWRVIVQVLSPFVHVRTFCFELKIWEKGLLPERFLFTPQLFKFQWTESCTYICTDLLWP